MGKHMKKLLTLALACAFASSFVLGADVYVAPGGTGDGSSIDSPTADLSWALENVTEGCTVYLAPGEYSVKDFGNQYECWGQGNTVLAFKVNGSALRGAGPDKTTIVAPNGFTGLRVERNNVTLADLSVKSYGTDWNAAAGYRAQLNGALCACNCSGILVTNVAVYSEQNDANGIRPFSTYKVSSSVFANVAVYAPAHPAPAYVLGCDTVTFNNMTVQGKENGDQAVYASKWWQGPSKSVVYNSTLFSSFQKPFHIEPDTDVTINGSVFYACPGESRVEDGASLTINDCESYELGVNDPELSEIDGYMLTAANKFYAGIGWHTLPEPAVFGLLALVALFLRRK